MDSIDPVLSPSKARQAASQAREWAFITSWLQRKYSPNPVPQFERNDDTLKVLLNITAANDSADEEEAVLHRARLEATQWLPAEDSADSRISLLEGIEASVDNKGSSLLEDLAEASVVLGVNPEPANMGHAIADLTREEIIVGAQIRQVETMQKYLDRDLEILASRLVELRDDPLYESSAELPAQTEEWLRGTKLLNAKIGEYLDRLAVLERAGSVGALLIGDLVAEEEEFAALQEDMKNLDNKLKIYRNMPSNPREAKAEYDRLEIEHRSLVRRRDQLRAATVSDGHS
jgi:HAUS augmin-like complex subunit 1